MRTSTPTRRSKTGKKAAPKRLVLGRYKPLSFVLFVMILIGVGLGWQTTKVIQDDQHDVLGDSITVSARVNGTPPATAATIDRPTDGQVFTSKEITVSGSCPDGSQVQLYKNGIFAGATICEASQYQLSIALLYGKNELEARVADNLQQYGPSSVTVSVTYQPTTETPSASSSDEEPVVPETPHNQLLVNTQTFYQGTSAGRALQFSYSIQGGEAPYAVNIEWGDGQQSLYTKTFASTFSAEHVYESGGEFKIMARVSDKNGHTSLIQGTALINGEKRFFLNTASLGLALSSPLTVSWMVYALLFSCLTFFWIGERYELHKVTKFLKPRRVK